MFLYLENNIPFIVNDSSIGKKIENSKCPMFRHYIMNEIDKNIDNSRSYSLGDLLQMPRIYYKYLQNGNNGYFPRTESETSPVVDRVLSIIKKGNWNGSILERYYSGLENGENPPNIDRLVDVIDKFIQTNNLHNEINFIKEQDTLVVHIRTGDRGVVDEKIVTEIYNLKQKFSKCVIVLGMEWSDNVGEFCERKKLKKDDLYENFYKSCKILLDNFGKETYILLADADKHTCMFRKCQNLFVHKGGFSAIGSLICDGNIFCSSEFEAVHNDNKIWKDLLRGKLIVKK